jgi:predicted GH43/DUF377 family glycosyl hydrolase
MPPYARIDRDVLVRYEGNPVLTPKSFEEQLGFKMRAVYNCAAVKTHDGRYVMLCRVNQLNHRTLLWGADSEDGLKWRLRPEPFEMPDDETWREAASTVYYDPRITWIDGEYKVLIAVQSTSECRVAMFRSADLAELEFVNYLGAPDNRNMVIFPEKSADGRYMRLERPNLPAAGGKGDIWLSHSPDLIHWGDSRRVVRTADVWNYGISGIGPSTVPYRTDEGWLIVFHAIMHNCTTREYSVAAALLDPDRPWQVRHVTRHPILYPLADYELTGLVEHVCFPCSKIVENDPSGASGQAGSMVKVYYGAADTVQCVATGRLEDIVFACKNW